MSTLNIKKFSLLLSIIFIAGSSFAQAPKIISSTGTIPSEFLTPSSIKYKKTIETYESSDRKNDNLKTKENKEEFYLASNFNIDNLLQSGYALFNDQLGEYTNEVMDQLPISEDLEKKKNPRIYVVNSNEVNAFATDQGIIFVTLGLLANVESEAQLAFILAHEISHIEEDHGLDKFLTYQEFEEEEGRMLKNLKDKKGIFTRAIYSKKLETEADEHGLELFLKSKYDPIGVDEVFTTLYYSYLSYSEESFDRSFFEDDNYKIPNKVWLDTVNAIQPMENGNEESTHPSSASRMKMVQENISKADAGDKNIFLLGEDRFNKIQEIARYQLPYLCLDNNDNARAIYNAYVLLKKYPEDLELEKLVAKALYKEVKRQRTANENNESRLSLYKHVKDMEGAIQRVDYLFKNMKARELTVLALKRNYEAWLEDKEDEQLNMAVNSLMVDLAQHYATLDEFSSAPRPVESDKQEIEPTTEEGTDDKELTREEKIKRANAESKEVVKDLSYAFVNYVNDTDFQDRFEKALKLKESWEENENNSKRSKTYYMVNNSVSLAIDKVVVVNPNYIMLNSRKDRSMKYIESEENQSIFQKQVLEVAELSDINLDLLSLSELTENDANGFNNLNELETYFQQQLELPAKGLHPSTNQNKINQIAESYGTDYFLWTGLISVGKNKIKPLAVTLGLVFPPAFASRIFDFIVYNDDTFFYAILFDVRNGKRRALKLDFIDGSLTKPLMKSHLYDIFNQISSN